MTSSVLKSDEKTALGILGLASAIFPVVGILINWFVLNKCKAGTNGNTCASMGIVLSGLVTGICCVVVIFYMFIFIIMGGLVENHPLE
jgi:hypothetical protein